MIPLVELLLDGELRVEIVELDGVAEIPVGGHDDVGPLTPVRLGDEQREIVDRLEVDITDEDEIGRVLRRSDLLLQQVEGRLRIALGDRLVDVERGSVE